MYDLKYKPTKPLKTLDHMSPNSTITNVTYKPNTPHKTTGNTPTNNTIQLPNINKNKSNDEDSKQSKNMTSAKLQELSLQYDMSRREIYEMHSTWHSMLEFTSSFLKRKGYNGFQSLMKNKNSMFVVNNMLELMSTKSEE